MLRSFLVRREDGQPPGCGSFQSKHVWRGENTLTPCLHKQMPISQGITPPSGAKARSSPPLQGLQVCPSWDIPVEPRRPTCTSAPDLPSLLQAFSRQRTVPRTGCGNQEIFAGQTPNVCKHAGSCLWSRCHLCAEKNNVKRKINIASLKPNKAAMFSWKIGAIIGTSFAVYSYKNSFRA